MVFKGLIAGLSAAALLAAPVAASAQQTGIVSRSIAAEPAPTAEQLNGQRMFQTTQDDDDDDGGAAVIPGNSRISALIVALLAAGLSITAILILLNILGDDDGIPVSS